MGRTVRTVIVAASESLRCALQHLLRGERDFEILGAAGTRREGAILAARHRPDLLIDTLPPSDEDAGQYLRDVESASPRTRYLFCFLVRRAIGGDGRLPPLLARDFIAALRPFAGAADEAGQPPRNGASATSTTLSSLTQRERQVLRLAAEGLNSSETGRQLGISARTVECHRAHGMRKLGLHRRAELTRFALQAGLFDGEQRAPENGDSR